MTDVHDPRTRSYNMSRIKSKNTKPELIVRKFLFSRGFRYKLHDRSLPGKPDLVFPRFKTVIFVHGCFWHGHTGCKYFVVPQTRKEWWIDKINRNRQKDTENAERLRELGWHVVTVYECQLRGDSAASTLSALALQLAAHKAGKSVRPPRVLR